MNILYICTGNTCRSPMAKVLTEVEADKRNIGHNVRSRGMAAHDGEGMSHGALKALAEEGINGSFHRAKTLSEKDLEWADKIYVMTHTMATNLKRGWPAYGDKIEAFAEKDVIDPFGADMTIYRFTKNSLMREVERKFEEDEL